MYTPWEMTQEFSTNLNLYTFSMLLPTHGKHTFIYNLISVNHLSTQNKQTRAFACKNKILLEQTKATKTKALSKPVTPFLKCTR